jgi:hypothetical protein
MDNLFAFIILFSLGGITLYILLTRVIIPIYKIYHDQLQIK